MLYFYCIVALLFLYGGVKLGARTYSEAVTLILMSILWPLTIVIVVTYLWEETK